MGLLDFSVATTISVSLPINPTVSREKTGISDVLMPV